MKLLTELSRTARWVVTISPWKLFLASILFPFLIFFVSVESPARETIWRNAKIVEALGYIGYNYLIGTSLFQRLPPRVSMNIRAFKSATSVLMLTLLMIVILSYFLSRESARFDLHNWPTYVALIAAITVTYCALYTAIFIVKEITSIELGRTAKYKDYIDLILFSMVFPFGVWVIQRRVKRIFEEV
jgi:hypothetical protein